MTKSNELFERASKSLIGGTGAGNRFHKAISKPLYISHADGARLYDVDGKEYIDYHSSAGPMLYGYNNPRIREAVNTAMDKGFFMYFESEAHSQLAEMICDILPSADMVRLSNTGTEATLGAIRIARDYTKRDLVIKFEGHFHGMHENIWYNFTNRGKMDEIGEIETIPDTAGVPDAMAELVKVLEFNDIDALERVVNRYKDQVAAIILEPVSYNSGCYPARKEYLEQVRELCNREGIILIFDEVITGFRMRPGSAQAYYGVMPDITVLAKALGGGFPIAAIAGTKEVMSCLSPMGKVGISGTYTGSYMSVLAAIECMKMVQEPAFYDHIDTIGDALYGGINDLFAKHGIKGHTRGIGARFGMFFGVENPEHDYNWREIADHFDSERYMKFLGEALGEGLYFHYYGACITPAHSGFTTAHTLDDVNITLERMDNIFKKIK